MQYSVSKAKCLNNVVALCSWFIQSIDLWLVFLTNSADSWLSITTKTTTFCSTYSCTSTVPLLKDRCSSSCGQSTIQLLQVLTILLWVLIISHYPSHKQTSTTLFFFPPKSGYFFRSYKSPLVGSSTVIVYHFPQEKRVWHLIQSW